ncbi:hypothetical protein FQN50_009138 [Emmonsiellopsis sp. PD_5]|nr:hypothetical protein FQN50_009138 [Emmonsiellopsis sp. PD_5]
MFFSDNKSNKSGDKLKIRVDPDDVRLIPDSKSPYAWKVAPSMQQLFKTNMSKHSVGAYQQLWKEVGGESLEAVAVGDASLMRGLVGSFPDQSGPTPAVCGGSTVVGPGGMIKAIQAENKRLTEELDHWKAQAACELKRREVAEEMIENLERRGEEWGTKSILLERQVEYWASVAQAFQSTTVRCLRGVTDTVSSLQGLQAELSFLSVDTQEDAPISSI